MDVTESIDVMALQVTACIHPHIMDSTTLMTGFGTSVEEDHLFTRCHPSTIYLLHLTTTSLR
jgi:hypothetical protein